MSKKSERGPLSPEDAATVERFEQGLKSPGTNIGALANRTPFMQPPPVSAIPDNEDAAEMAAWWSKRQPQDEEGLLT